MASPQGASHPLRHKSSANNLNVTRKPDADLTKSLRQLSLSTETANAGANSQLSPRSPLTRTVSSPLRPPSRHASPSPNRRASSRSPSSGREPSVSGERTLLRKASTNSLRSANGMMPGQSSSRRSSFARTISPTSSSPPERIIMTATTVAKSCLQEELDVLHGQSSTVSTDTIVILNDAVYGHRFSRPRTSKNALGTIVERPERIKAGVLGISMAYVRLGERHCEGNQPLHPKRDVHGMLSIPFKIHKTTRRLPLISPAVTNVHGTKWMEELKTMCESAEAKLAMGSKELQRPERSRGEPAGEKLHEGDLYLCSESLNAIEGALGAVCEAVDTVFGSGPNRAFVGVRPPGHHCSASHPSGFCWVNNVHVGIMHAAMEHGLTHAAIIDFDLHHGDGSQSITWQHNKRSNMATKNAAPWKKSSIGYFSLHDINSYPCEGGDDEKVKNASLCIDNAHGQSVWNLHLQPYKSEEDFWELYNTKYSILLEKTRNYLKTQYERVRAMNQTPKAAIFFSAGFDASEWEGAGMQRHQVNVPTEFYARLSQDVVKVAGEEGLGVDGRVISVLEGGYSDRALYSGVCSHLTGLVGEQTIPQTPPPQSPNGLGIEMGQRIGSVAEESTETEFVSQRRGYDASWWAVQELDNLEHRMVNPEPPPRVIRQQSPGTYASPTQASTAKVVDPANMRRSLSGLGNGRPMSRPSSPPAPEVPWTIATHELCKLLIPTDRQVDSCKPEDLNAEATRQRQARQSSVMPPPERGASRMSLRGRKPKAAAPEAEEAMPNRRRPAGAPAAAEKVSRSVPTTPAKATARRTSRRLSGAPTALATPVKEPMPQPGPAVPSSASRAPAPRPELAHTGRSQSTTSINLKKTRPSTAGTGAKREPAAKTTAAPRASKKVSSVASGSGVMDSPDPLAASRPATADGDDMDKITTGMKKIKINLITKSQKEARERARQDEAAKAAAAAMPSSSTPVPEESTAVVKTEPDIGSPEVEIPSASTSQAGTGELVSSPVDSASDAGRYVPLGGYTASSGVTSPEPDHKPMDTLPGPSTPTIPQVAIQHSDAGDDFIPYQPEGPSPETFTPTEPLKWMPPNINTPAATPSPAKKDQTFKYTSGPIPFGPRPGSSVMKGAQLPPPKETKDI